MFSFKISHHSSRLQPVLAWMVTSMSCKALSDYITSAAIRKGMKNLHESTMKKALLFLKITIHTSPFFYHRFLVNIQLGKFCALEIQTKNDNQDKAQEFRGQK